MTENEKKLLVELTSYDTDEYKELEALKIKVKDM